MNEKLRKYIDNLFEQAPKTRKAWELKEELYANSMERLLDLQQDGVEEENAYQMVIESMGDVTSLFRGLSYPEENRVADEKNQQKRALLLAVSIGIYIFGVAVFLGLSMLPGILGPRIDTAIFGLIFLILISIFPTCILVYLASSKPKYTRMEDSVVEEFREWSNDKQRDQEIKKAISGILWSLILILYFVISFTTDAWYITWVLFIVGVCVDKIISLMISLKRDGRK